MHDNLHRRRGALPAAAAAAIVLASSSFAGAAETSHVLIGVAPSSEFGVVVDGQAPAQGTFPSDALGILEFDIDDSGLPPGGHSVSVSLPEPIVISSVVVDSITESGAIVRWETNVPSDSRVEYGPTGDYGFETDVVPDLVFEHEVRLDGLAAASVYHLRAVSADAFGQTAYSGDVQFETSPLPLQVTVVSVPAVGPTWALVEWETNRPATSLVEYGLTDAYGMSSDEDTLAYTSHSVTLTGLLDGATYHFRVLSSDALGFDAASNDSTFTTLEVEPTGPPIIGGVHATPEGVNAVVISWTTDRPATSQVLFGLKGELDCSTEADTSAVTEHTVRLCPVVPRHVYSFVALSACGPDTASSATMTFTAWPADTAEGTGKPVTIDRPGLLHVGETSAVIAWATDRPCTTWVEYGTDEDLGTISGPLGRGEPLRGSYGHSVELTDLVPGTDYYYKVVACDAFGGLIDTGNQTFRTSERPDEDAPEPPGSLECAVREGGIALAWSPCSEEDLAGYVVYRLSGERPEAPEAPFDLARASRLNDSPLVSTSYLDTDVVEHTQYAYVVTAVDRCGNESGPSNSASVRYVAAGATVEFSVCPNPSYGDSELGFVAPAGASVVARVFSPGGRLVREFRRASHPGGPGAFDWDGRDAVNRPVGTGVFVCELSVDGATARRKLTILR